MAKQSVGFVDQHIEKVVLGVCIAGLVGVVFLYFVQDPYGSKPSELFEEARKAADQTRQRVLNAEPPPDPPSGETGGNEEVLRIFIDWFDPIARKGLVALAGIRERLARVQQFPTALLPVAETAAADRHGLARIVAPGVPIVTTGTTTFDIPPAASLAQFMKGSVPAGEPSERSWVSVGAQVPLKDLLRSYLAAGYKPGELGLVVTGIELQRKMVGQEEADWETVEHYLPFIPPSKPRLTFDANGEIEVSASNAKERYLKTIRHPAVQELIRGSNVDSSVPPVAQGTRGDKFEFPQIPFNPLPPPDEAADPKGLQRNETQNARIFLSIARKALAGSRPFDEPDPDAASVLASSALGLMHADPKVRTEVRTFLENEVTPRLKKLNRPLPPPDPPELETMMPILAHDLTVVAGHAYVYRIRYEIYNFFAGNSDIMQDMEDARKLTLWSEWSPASREVEVKSDTSFYISKASRQKRDEVQVTVFKMGFGDKVDRKTFTVEVGDVIGGPGSGKTRGIDFTTDMICVDLDFDARVDGKNDVALVYVNRRDGTLWERYADRDRNDPRFEELRRKAR